MIINIHVAISVYYNHGHPLVGSEATLSPPAPISYLLHLQSLWYITTELKLLFSKLAITTVQWDKFLYPLWPVPIILKVTVNARTSLLLILTIISKWGKYQPTTCPSQHSTYTLLLDHDHKFLNFLVHMISTSFPCQQLLWLLLWWLLIDFLEIKHLFFVLSTLTFNSRKLHFNIIFNFIALRSFYNLNLKKSPTCRSWVVCLLFL